MSTTLSDTKYLVQGNPLPFLPDTQTLEQSTQDCTAEQVGQFLERIGLGDHVAAFSEQDISGEELLGLDQETLKELGVTSAVERLKIKVHSIEDTVGYSEMQHEIVDKWVDN